MLVLDLGFRSCKLPVHFQSKTQSPTILEARQHPIICHKLTDLSTAACLHARRILFWYPPQHWNWNGSESAEVRFGGTRETMAVELQCSWICAQGNQGRWDWRSSWKWSLWGVLCRIRIHIARKIWCSCWVWVLCMLCCWRTQEGDNLRSPRIPQEDSNWCCCPSHSPQWRASGCPLFAECSTFDRLCWSWTALHRMLVDRQNHCEQERWVAWCCCCWSLWNRHCCCDAIQKQLPLPRTPQALLQKHWGKEPEVHTHRQTHAYIQKDSYQSMKLRSLLLYVTVAQHDCKW